MTPEEHLQAHRDATRPFVAAGVGSFVREEGEGEPVLCLHGVPVFSYLYRKLLPELGARGLRGVAFDLPGLGFADRPEAFDYTWTGLGRWAVAAVDALALDRFHLVVHDLGGPVGFELAAAMPERVRSLTVLDTLVAVDGFTKPWTMRPFEYRGLGELWLATMIRPLFLRLMYLQGVADRVASPPEQLVPYLTVLKRDDGGRAFLKMMRGFETTADKEALYRAVVGDERYPRQVIWGEGDTALRIDSQGVAAQHAAGVADIIRLPAKHFLQEDQAPAIADRIAALAG